MRLFLVFIFISFKVLSQNYEPTMEFDYDFILDAQPFKDLCEDYYNKERVNLKIKQIKKVVHGSESLDSLYLKNPKNFKIELDQIKLPFPLNHTSYSYIEIYNYNNLGELIAYQEYPICMYLTNEDSLRFSKRIIKTTKLGDQTLVSRMYNDTIYTQLTFKKNQLISKFNRKELNISKLDSSSKTYISKFFRINEYFKYTYLKDGKISEISVNDKLILQYKYPTLNKTIIRNFQFGDMPGDNQLCENTIIKNSNGKPIMSLFYQPSYNKYKQGYILEYDMHGYLIKIIKTEFEEKNYENKYTYIEYINTYKNNKLIKTLIPKKYKNNEDDLIYTYNEKGYVLTCNYWGGTEFYEYTFFD